LQSRLFIRGRDPQPWVWLPASRAHSRIAVCRNRDAFKSHKAPTAGQGARIAMGRHEMDASVLIAAPLGLGILLALGILMVAMSYLSQ